MSFSQGGLAALISLAGGRARLELQGAFGQARAPRRNVDPLVVMWACTWRSDFIHCLCQHSGAGGPEGIDCGRSGRYPHSADIDEFAHPVQQGRAALHAAIAAAVKVSMGSGAAAKASLACWAMFMVAMACGVWPPYWWCSNPDNAHARSRPCAAASAPRARRSSWSNRPRSEHRPRPAGNW